MHIGEKIKLRSKELRIGPTELGEMINTSKQNIYGIFRRENLDTSLLRAISLALEFNFFELLARELEGSLPSEPLREELKALEREMEYLKRINQLQLTLLEKEGIKFRPQPLKKPECPTNN
ncbi:MAG: hypothetical protein H6581_22625 [Bacteroidia bacterium]|nr:hypothetical protein [Bacteroidia bacterium]